MRNFQTILLFLFTFFHLTVFSQITNNYISSNQIVCDGGTPFPLHGEKPMGGNGSTYDYLWITSTDSITWLPAIGINNIIDYYFTNSFTGLPKFYFARQVISGTFTDTSNVITITVLLGTPTIDDNFITSDQTLCWGELPDSIGGNTPTGGSGTYYYLWLKSLDASFTNPMFLDITNNLQYYKFSDSPDTSFYYIRVAAIDQYFNQCPTVSNPILIDVFSITDNHLPHYMGICAQNDADTIKGPVPNMTYIDSITYQWQESIDNINWNPASGINHEIHYIPLNIIDSMFFRRRITADMKMGCGILDTMSNPVKVKRNPPIENNIIFSYHPNACNGEQRWVIQDTSINVGGGDGNYFYLWEESIDITNWTTAIGQYENLNYLTSPIFATKYFRRIIFSGGCVDTSNIVTITSDPTSGIGNNKILINGEESDTLCAGSIINTLNGSIPNGGNGTYTYLWFFSYDLLNWDVVPPPELNQNYDTPLNSTSTYYIRSVTSGTCYSESNLLSINIINANDNIIWDNQNICNSSNIDSIYGNYPQQTYGATFYFLWEVSNDSINWTTATGSTATQQNYYPGTISSSKYYRRNILFPMANCNTAYDSNVIKISLAETIQNNIIFPINFPDYTICYNTTTIIGNTAPPEGGDGTYEYLWQDSISGSTWQDAPLINNTFWYSTMALYQDTYFRRKVTSCGQTNYSNTLQIIVDPLPSYTVHIDDSICIDNGAQIVFNFQGLTPWYYTFNDGFNTYTSNNIYDVEYFDYLTPTENSTYTITDVVDANGCHASNLGQSFDVIVFEKPIAFAGFDTVICGKVITDGLNAVLSDPLNWGNWEDNPDIYFDDPSNPNTNAHTDFYGTYTLTWREFNARCLDLSYVNISFYEELDSLKSFAGEDVYLDFEYIYSLNAIVPDSYFGHWEMLKGGGLFVDDYDPNTVIYNLSNGENIITWTLTNSICKDHVDTILIDITSQIMVPSGFSPNNDGVNDLLVIKGLSEQFIAEIWIFDRWGVEQYYNDNYKNDWNGKGYNNVDLPDDTYFFIIKIKDMQTYKGSLEIKR